MFEMLMHDSGIKLSCIATKSNCYYLQVIFHFDQECQRCQTKQNKSISLQKQYKKGKAI